MVSSEKCDGTEPNSKDLIWYIGFVLICWIVFKIARSLWRGFYTCVLAETLGLTVDWKKVGKWAVITGATDGIGKSYAKALAAKGFDIVLISRTPEKLRTVAEEIEKKYGVKTRTIAIDITSGPEIYQAIKNNINDIEIGVLINNVGMSYAYAEYITKVPDGEKFADDLIKANIISCTKMTQLVLPQMEERRKGVIINVSSLSALSPVPLLSIYSASKVYVSFFTRATQEEYRSKGIIIQSVLPGFVSTNMSKMRPSFTTCTPDAFVKWALRTVGVEDQTYGYPVHKLQGYVQESMGLLLPENVNIAINHRMMNSIRTRYYKKFGLVDDEKKKSNSSKEK